MRRESMPVIKPRTVSDASRYSAALLIIIVGALLIAGCETPEPQTSADTLSGRSDSYSIASGKTLRQDAPGVLAIDQVSD